MVGDEGFDSNSCFSSWFRSTRAILLVGLRISFGIFFVDQWTACGTSAVYVCHCGRLSGLCCLMLDITGHHIRSERSGNF